MDKKLRFGTIVAACTNPDEGVRKFPRERVTVGEYGLVGDYHNRAMRRSFSKPGTLKPNVDRHITIVAAEAFEHINQELGTSLAPGDFGENLHVQGLGDLSDVPDGAIVSIGSAIIFRVIEQNQPCVNLRPYHRLMVKQAYGRRGLLCAIVRGRGADISPGDEVIFHIDGEACDSREYWDKIDTLHHQEPR